MVVDSADILGFDPDDRVVGDEVFLIEEEESLLLSLEVWDLLGCCGP